GLLHRCGRNAESPAVRGGGRVQSPFYIFGALALANHLSKYRSAKYIAGFSRSFVTVRWQENLPVFDRSDKREHAAFARPVSRFARRDTLVDGFELHALETRQQMLPNLNVHSIAFVGHALHCYLALLTHHQDTQH